jgi:hypothetical protein
VLRSLSTALLLLSPSLLAQRGLVTLPGKLHPWTQPGFDRGRVAADTTIGLITVSLKRLAAQQAELEKLLEDQQDPSSPDYHRWLTHAVRKTVTPHPNPNSRQHEHGLNWRAKRIRPRNPGVRAEPWGFRSHPEAIILETENGREPQETTECLGYPANVGVVMASTESRLEIGTAEWWLPKISISNRFLRAS